MRMELRSKTAMLVLLGLGASACPNEPKPAPGEANASKAAASKPAEPAPAKATPGPSAEAKPVEAKSLEAKPAEVKPSEPAPTEATPTEAKPGEPMPTEVKPGEPTPGEPTPKPGLATDSTSVPVFAAFGAGGKWEVELTDFTGMDVKELKRRLGKKGERIELAAGDSAIPAGFAIGDPWTLVTSTGPDPRTAASISAYKASRIDADSVMHLAIGLGEGPKDGKATAIALRGHVGPGIALVVPTAIGPDEVGAGTHRSIVDAIHAKVGSPIISVSKVVRPQDVKLYPGRFPGNRTHVVVVQSDDSEVEENELVAGVLLLGADGSVELVQAGASWVYATLVGLIDVNGDGFDEVVYQFDTNDPWSLEMIEWDGEKISSRSRTLAEGGP